VADLQHEKTRGDLQTATYIHTHKTGMMFRAACRMGAWCAGADQDEVDLLGDYGLKIGLAFQIVDDLLDVTSSSEELGKHTQKDEVVGKLTYPGILGVEASRERAERLIGEAVSSVGRLGENGEPLRQLARMLAERKS